MNWKAKGVLRFLSSLSPGPFQIWASWLFPNSLHPYSILVFQTSTFPIEPSRLGLFLEPWFQAGFIWRYNGDCFLHDQRRVARQVAWESSRCGNAPSVVTTTIVSPGWWVICPCLDIRRGNYSRRIMWDLYMERWRAVHFKPLNFLTADRLGARSFSYMGVFLYLIWNRSYDGRHEIMLVGRVIVF